MCVNVCYLKSFLEDKVECKKECVVTGFLFSTKEIQRFSWFVREAQVPAWASVGSEYVWGGGEKGLPWDWGGPHLGRSCCWLS